MFIQLTKHHYIDPKCVAEVFFNPEGPSFDIRHHDSDKDCYPIRGEEALESWGNWEKWFASQEALAT
jgi:hypothetical protein